MKRTGFARRVYQRQPSPPVRPIVGCRGVYAPAANEPVVIAKEVTAKPGKRTPTAIEAKWMAAIVDYGCVACRMDGQAPRPTAVHHILRGGRRIGHLFTLGLCDPGHHQNGAALGLISRHPYKARFEEKYGSELELLAKLKVDLGVFDQAEYRP